MRIEEQPYDDRHTENPFRAPMQGAMDRHAEVVGGTPVHVDRSKLAESVEAARPLLGADQVGRTRTVIPYGHPDNLVTQIEKARGAIKGALRGLLAIDVASDDDEGIVTKLHAVADGLIEAL